MDADGRRWNSPQRHQDTKKGEKGRKGEEGKWGKAESRPQMDADGGKDINRMDRMGRIKTNGHRWGFANDAVLRPKRIENCEFLIIGKGGWRQV
jgi:hypothetical protein